MQFKPKSSKVVIVNNDGKVMLVKITGKELYDLPGGHQEPGETAAAAAVREVKEEVGLDIFHVEQIGMTDRKDFFVTQIFSGEIKLQEEEVSEHVWVEPTRIVKYSVTDEVEKGIALYHMQ
jgi:8-oxo-dGTP pyrophosphatase MutT (NUDIX family)